ncbi:ABC transporter ATP-binding protein [Roseomonas sp. KE2513]|uniref:ABC transporter ATP-binding protein n=1 Tax=Roseomonas sp. KE2513 TaxID=2479202 RepID=UPI0028164780|nr:ABC transporter ATP-binding protein [Roseomonas sp. KE2513]MBI0538995.1 ABC transporter ATP-binding protein [Roseomonas sp. KE2513]
MPDLSVTDLHAGYGAVRVLHGVSLNVRHGETVALLGTNGNGKSTLMKCLAGLLRPSGGQILLDGKLELGDVPPQDVVAAGISLVPEGRRLFPRLSVEENLVLGAFRSEARATMYEELEKAWETFPVLREKRRQVAGSLSGGQQQMVAIARALMACPRVLLVDEPSVGLAPILVAQVIDILAQLKAERGLTVLMAEQNFQQAARIADRGYVLVHGEVAFNGSMAELTESEAVRVLYLGV